MIPIDVHLGLPTIETFYKRIVKVKVCPKSNNKTLSPTFKDPGTTNGNILRESLKVNIKL